MAKGTDSDEFILLSRVRSGLKHEFTFSMKAQSEICAASLGRTRASKNRPDPSLQPASARKCSRKAEEPKPLEDLVFWQQSTATGGVGGGGDERQPSPVRGISLKLQEEEHEHRMDFVPEVFAINIDHIEVDKETLDMLHSLGINDLFGITHFLLRILSFPTIPSLSAIESILFSFRHSHHIVFLSIYKISNGRGACHVLRQGREAMELGKS